MDIKSADVGRLWSLHYPNRKTDRGADQMCKFLCHEIINVVQETEPWDGDIADRVRIVLASLGVSEAEFHIFSEEASRNYQLRTPRARRHQ